MSRKPSPKRAEALRIWLKSGREKKLKEIADELGVNPSQVRKWKSQDAWDDIPESAPRRGAPYRNKNAVGNKGGAPLGNQNAVTHGYFKKWLPDEEDLQEIYEAIIEGMSPIDLLYQDIVIGFTNYIHAQKIMFVRDIDDMTRVIKSQSSGAKSDSISYEIQHAWDKQAKALTAQAAASNALVRKIKQYEEMLRSMPPDQIKEEHRLRISKMKADIEKTKAETKATSNPMNTTGVDLSKLTLEELRALANK